MIKNESMADIVLRCTRRKQANPRRKNVELENTMPSDTDLTVDVAENADSAQSLNKSKHFMDLSSHTQQLTISANQMNTSMKAKKTSSKTKHHMISSNDISSSELSAKQSLCNTTTRNGYKKSKLEDNNHNNDNEKKDIIKQAVNGHEADETDTEEEKDYTTTNETNEESRNMSNEPSVNCLDEQIEDNKIKEYLQRRDTAVIFAEPVDKEELKSDSSKNGSNEESGQSVADAVDEKDHKDGLKTEKNGLKTDKSRMPENGSPNQSESTAMLSVVLARCPHCGKLFRGPRSSLSLQEHITNIHAAIAPISKPTIASSPSSIPSSSDTLVVAQSDHQMAYVCSKCKASFMQKDHLEKHELLHSTQGQSCQLCNKSFANVYRLQRHMLSHDESQVLRKFKCPECFKAFKFKHHLKEHIRIHSGEKPFACPNCGKRFSHSGSYSSHMTSKKCLVVNLKVRKVDQIRSQRTRNNHSSVNGVNANGLTSQSSTTKTDILANSHTNPRLGIDKKDDAFDVSSANRTISVLKSETQDNFPPLFLPSELRGCAAENSSFGSYVPSSYSSGLTSLHPALFSAAAASVGLPTHYLSSALSSYPEVANAILRSQMDKSVKDIEISKEKCSIGCNNKIDSMKQSDTKTILENYDLNSMRKILQIVDATVAAKTHHESSANLILNGSYGEIRSSNPSPLALSASSLHLPQIAPIDSPDDIKKSFTNSMLSSRCRYCSEYFDSKIDLHQHESYLCKSRQSLSTTNKSSNETTKDTYSNDLCTKTHQQSNALHSSAAESDEESQRDSSSLDDEIMMNDGKKVRVRSVLGEETLRILRAQYEINPRPKKHDILRLSEEVNYSPRVVQVWFQNMRARDRRLGKPIPSVHLSGDLNLSNLHNQRVVTSFSPSHHSTPQHSIQTPLMPISIPHYKPASNISLSGNHSFSPTLTPFPSDINGLSLYGQRHNNNAVYYVNSSEFSMTPYSKPDSNKQLNNQSDSLSLSDEPLDLSVRNKSYLEDLTNNNNTEPIEKYTGVEVLNLSQKSTRSQTNENSNDDVLPSNISLAILQQQQRKELEQTSIVRSMLMNKCRSEELDSSISRFNILNVVNGTAIQSPDRITRCSPTIVEEKNEISREFRKRSHSDSEDVGHQSDSNNPSDEYTSGNSPSRTKVITGSPSKLWKGNGDNVISRDDQSSPPDANIQVDGPGLFTCDQCDKTFSKQSSLARHKYEHSGQRPHKCDVCNKAFKHKHHLTEHKRLHSGEKPFQCKKCLKRFSHSGSYSQHMNHRYSYCKPYRE